VVVVSGLRREASLLAGPNRVSLCGDSPGLRRRLAQIAGSKPKLVISWGLCGGLDPRLRPGDLVVGDEATFGGESIRTDGGVAAELKRRLGEAGHRVCVGRVAVAEAPVLTAGEKGRLRASTDAAVVDTESFLAGRFAREVGAPFAILRAVCDPAARDLPPLAATAIDSEGRVDARAVFAHLARAPGQIALLGWAARDSAAAFASLRRCGRLLPGLFLGLGLPDLLQPASDALIEDERGRALAI